jgi:hypothetical protein
MKTTIGDVPAVAAAGSTLGAAGASRAVGSPAAADGTGCVHETFEMRHQVDTSRRLRVHLFGRGCTCALS